MRKILLDEGSGGRASQRLITDLFVRHFSNDILSSMDDAALLFLSGAVSMSTDSYTVDPVEFSGGNIGSLAIHGTVNDVSMLGAVPRFIACAFILEEGISFALLERVVVAMAYAAKSAGVRIVTGDTKVVPKGAADKIFITTTGVGEIIAKEPLSGTKAKAGDAILLSGTIGDHGLAILASRSELSFSSNIQSDSAALNHIVVALIEQNISLHVLRDPTRGGLATTLNEIAEQSDVEIAVLEENIPVHPDVIGGCSLLGLDPLYLANEGKFICILPERDVEQALQIIRSFPEGKEAMCIGKVSEKKSSGARVLLETPLGGRRLLSTLEGEQLPRIC